MTDEEATHLWYALLQGMRRAPRSYRRAFRDHRGGTTFLRATLEYNIDLGLITRHEAAQIGAVCARAAHSVR